MLEHTSSGPQVLERKTSPSKSKSGLPEKNTPSSQTSKNAELGLPTDKMKQVIIAFDVDGTLRDNTITNRVVANEKIRSLLVTLASFKNTYIVVWSGSGQLYAKQAVNELAIAKYVDLCMGKEQWQNLHVDIAIDDIQDTNIGKINLIVREK